MLPFEVDLTFCGVNFGGLGDRFVMANFFLLMVTSSSLSLSLLSLNMLLNTEDEDALLLEALDEPFVEEDVTVAVAPTAAFDTVVAAGFGVFPADEEDAVLVAKLDEAALRVCLAFVENLDSEKSPKSSSISESLALSWRRSLVLKMAVGFVIGLAVADFFGATLRCCSLS